MSKCVRFSSRFWWSLVAGSAALAGWIGCSQSPPAGPAQAPTGDNKTKGAATMAMTIRSTAFEAGARIPNKHTGEGADVSPSLTWSDVPAGTAEFALIMDDPDAPVGEPWVHWVIYRIPAGATGLKEGAAHAEKLTDPAGALQGKNSWSRTGYNGPLPPPGHGTHHYHFKLYALDQALSLSPGLTKPKLLEALRGHILAQGELIGTYSR